LIQQVPSFLFFKLWFLVVYKEGSYLGGGSVVFGTVGYGTHYYMEIQFFDKLRDVSPEKDILNYPSCFCYNTWSCPTASDT
jgi:hypothetical protein